MKRIDDDTLKVLPLSEVEIVTFYKRDEITADLICCDVAIGGSVHSFHEELDGWDLLLRHLFELPDFKADWFAAVSQPAFQASETVAFRR